MPGALGHSIFIIIPVVLQYILYSATVQLDQAVFSPRLRIDLQLQLR